jgi:hypothetical protein
MMRKTLTIAVAAGLVAGCMAAPATAKKAKGPKAKAYTLYMHGNHPAGEAEYVEQTANGTGFMTMDTNEPTESFPRSTFVTNYLRGPNSTCSGNGLFPTWTGAVTGKISGNMTVYLNALAHPAGQVKVDVFADANGGCESALGSTGYTPPVASQVVDLAPGPAENEIVFRKVSFSTFANIVVMVTPVMEETAGVFYPWQTRLLYDSPDFATRIEFRCKPLLGRSCTG